MSTTAPPTIPPRPTRVQQAAAAEGVSRGPEIPPRPANKKTISNRSISPANYPQSPLFEIPSNTVGRTISNDPSNLNLPPRPPSVNLPSIGQEGSEYADLQYDNPAPQSAHGMEAATQTRNVRGDLQLHAPKPSLPTLSAKTQVEAVTKTTAKQAAALGLGKPSTPVHEDHEHAPVPLRAKSSFSRPASSASNERRASIVYGEEQGPAEQGGIRVPINPLLGDVQAPSPAPFGDKASIISANNGAHGQRKRHIRTMSGREVFLPPGSYGLHGHGVPTQDKFEKDWYAKHPEQYLHDEDQGHYSSTWTGRGEFALSSEDLNDIVRSTASRGAGFGASGLSAYPDEQIGYLASEQYASRSSSAPNTLSKLHSNVSLPAIESPLCKTSFPADDVAPADVKKSKGSVSGRSDDVVDSEQDDDIIHVDDPKYHYNKISGGQETREKEEMQPYVAYPTEENGLIDEYGYSVPILASDEVAREVGGEDMQPAVLPTPDRRGSAYDLEFRGSGDITPSSRPVSRPSSIHGGVHGVSPSLSRFTSRLEDYKEEMHTPLEDVDEYEPLFPDEDGKKKGVSPAERFKRPDTLKHRFPSQDIWEDTPSSAMHVATVSTPDIPSQIEQPKEASSSRTFESPEAEAARKEKPTEEEKKKRTPNEERLAKSKFTPHLRDGVQTRPGLPHRFPSQDIWEETPDSQYLVTTVSSQQEEEMTSTEETSTLKPTIPPRPNKSRLGEGASSAQIQPSVPPRPEKKVHTVPPVDAKLPEISTSTTSKDEKAPSPTELRQAPSIPDRPKPQVPARPGKKTSGDSLSKTISATSAGSSGSMETEKGIPTTTITSPPPPVKAKPSIPPRPGQGSKIANLKGNFMNDLNQRLQLGPPKEKEPEIEAEKEVKPLEDARKGRARGPQRRAPAKSPSSSGESVASTTEKQVRFSLSSPMTMWHINSADGSLRVHNHTEASSTKLENVLEESERVHEASESITKAAADDGLLKMPESNIAQKEHSTPGGAPMGRVAEGTIDEGTADSKTAQTSGKQTTDVPETMAPASLAMNTAGEPVDPSPAADQATPHAELANPMDKLRKHESGDTSLSQQTTASSGAQSGHMLGRVRAQDHEQGSSLSNHTTASSAVSGATLDRQPTLEDSNRNVAEVIVEEPKETAPAPETEEEKLAGADRPREPSGEEDITYKKLEEMTAKADGKGHSGLEPEV